MRFLIDESTDIRLGYHLADLGHDVKFVARQFVPGLADTEVLAAAQREGRVLITDDRDFGELVYRQLRPHAGVIYLRLGTTRLRARIERLGRVLSEHAHDLGEFIVVTDHGTRVGEAPQRSAA